MAPRNLLLTAGLATLLFAGAGTFAESSGQEQTNIVSDRAVQWYLRLKGTKA